MITVTHDLTDKTLTQLYDERGRLTNNIKIGWCPILHDSMRDTISQIDSELERRELGSIRPTQYLIMKVNPTV